MQKRFSLHYSCLFSCYFFSLALLAQTNSTASQPLKGVVLDSLSRQAIAFATVALFDTLQKQPLQVVATDNDGQFSFSGLDQAIYRLEVAMIGYQARVLPAIKPNDPTTPSRLNPIVLQPTSELLNAVTIAAQRPVWELKSDRFVYNAQNDAKTEGSVLELLRRVPFVSIDADDNIQVKGQTSFKVQLNGRNTGMVARNPKEALRAMPAGSIQKVEVITSPSARDDGDNTSGYIINLISNKRLAGYNANVGISVNTWANVNGNLGLDAKMGKWGLSGHCAYHEMSNVEQSVFSKAANLQSEQPNFQYNTGNGDSFNRFMWSNLEIACDIDSLNTISIYGGYSPRNGGSNRASTMRFYDQNDITLQNGTQQAINDDTNKSVDLGADYIKKFRQEGRSFSASWAYATEQSQDANTNQQNINYLPQLYFQNKGNTKNNTHTVALDYEQPNRRKPDNVWRVGAKAIQRQVITDNVYALYDDSSQLFVPNAALSSQMDYVQQTAAIYTEYSHKAGKWGFKGGLRGEYTWVDAQFLNNNTQAKQQYLNLLPTLSANYALSTERNLTWSYRKGISRPWVRYLNPFINSNNPQFLYQGNPELLPELTHKLEISYNQSKKGKNLSISLAQNIRQQVISDIVTIDSLAIALQTYNNSGSLYSSSLSVAYSAMLLKKLNISLSTTVSYNTLNGTIGTTAVRNSGVVMSANGNINYNIGKGWKTGGYGYFRSGDIDLQGNNLPYFSYSIRVSKSLWKDNLTLSLSANMPFHQNVKYGSMQHSPDFDIENTTSQRTRNFSIRVNYKFGKLKEAVSRKKGIQNDDLKTGG